ncbi:MAG: DUF502 domain-containing protein [Parvularculaceae bacterium]
MSEDNKENRPEGERLLDTALIKPTKQSLLSNLRANFIAGIVVAAPIGITAALVYWFLTGPMAKLDAFVKKALPDSGGTLDAITHAIPGLGVLIAFIGIILLGALAKNFIGRAFIKAGEELVSSMPIVRTLHKFFKSVFETALQQSHRSFKEVALVEYPKDNIWVLAFVVGETKGEVRYSLRDKYKDIIGVFIPTVPNPTSGFLLYLPRSQARILTMSVEEAAKSIFSIGLVTPEFIEPDEAVKKLEALAAEAAAAPVRKPVFRLPLYKSNRTG